MMAAPPLLTFDYSHQPDVAYSLHSEFNNEEATQSTENSNFLKGVKWSPDGLAFLTVADDNWIRIYDTPIDLLETTNNPSKQQQQPEEEEESPPAIRIHAGELVYDYAWYTGATAADPSSWCLASTARGHPIHIWDALTGDLRCSYRSYDAVDEPTAAYSIAFNTLGSALYTGHQSAIHIFDIERPGREYTTLKTHIKGSDGQQGIISCLAFAPGPSNDLFAAGSYTGSVGLYDPRSLEQLFILYGHKGGVVHLKFSADGNYLYTGARQDDLLYCWDARFASGAVYTMQRATSTTHQRVYFDIEPVGRHLATGGEDGCVKVFDLTDGKEIASFKAAADTVNGIEYHPHVAVMATASGHRRYYQAPSSSSDDDGSDQEDVDGIDLSPDENVLRLWRLKGEPVALVEQAAGEEGNNVPVSIN